MNMNGHVDADLEQGQTVSTHLSNSVRFGVTNADHCEAEKHYRYIAYGLAR